MTAPIYTRGSATATKQLSLPPTGKGAALTLTRVTAGGEYIPGGGESAPTETQYAGSGIRTAYRLQDIDGTLIQSSDVRFLVSPVLLNGGDMPVPVASDTVTFGGIVYNVISCKALNFDGQTEIGFIVQGRV